MSFRGDAKHRARNLEILRCAIAHPSSVLPDRLGMTAEAVRPASPPQILPHLLAQALAQVRSRHGIGDVGAQEARLRAAIVALAGEFNAVELLRRAEADHGVGELDLAAGAARLGGEDVEDLGLQNVAAG